MPLARRGFELLTALFFPDHRDQQRLLGVYRDSSGACQDPARKRDHGGIICTAWRRRRSPAQLIPRWRATRLTKATDLRQAYRDPVAYKDCGSSRTARRSRSSR